MEVGGGWEFWDPCVERGGVDWTFLLFSCEWVVGGRCRKLSSLREREWACQVISCKNNSGIDNVLDWLVKHSKTKS